MSKYECFLFIETNEIGGLESGKCYSILKITPSSFV